LTENFEAWLASHDEFMKIKDSTGLDAVFKKALEARKYRLQSIDTVAYKYLADFHNTLVGLVNAEGEKLFGNAADAKKYQDFVNGKSDDHDWTSSEIEEPPSNFEEVIQLKINEFIETTHDIVPCSGYCYMPSIGSADNPDMMGIPIKPIGGQVCETEIKWEYPSDAEPADTTSASL
jgi:hypothetical protein